MPLSILYRARGLFMSSLSSLDISRVSWKRISNHSLKSFQKSWTRNIRHTKRPQSSWDNCFFFLTCFIPIINLRAQLYGLGHPRQPRKCIVAFKPFRFNFFNSEEIRSYVMVEYILCNCVHAVYFEQTFLAWDWNFRHLCIIDFTLSNAGRFLACRTDGLAEPARYTNARVKREHERGARGMKNPPVSTPLF